jgi:hypothetical protein
MGTCDLEFRSQHIITIIVFLLGIGSMSPVWVEGSFSWLRRIFTWVHQLVSSVIWLDTLLLSHWHTTQVERKHEIYYDDYYAERDDITKSLPSQKRNTWRLLLLLLPLIFLAGKWFHLLKISVHLWLTSWDPYFQIFFWLICVSYISVLDMFKLFK